MQFSLLDIKMNDTQTV